jgi:reverse gyrase
MIPGFEELTDELSEAEIVVAHRIVFAFKARGEDKPITSTEIIRKMKAKGYSIDGPRLRKIIQYIRTKQLLKWLGAAGSNGYEWTTNPEKIKKYTESLYKRENSIRSTRLSFPKY